MRLPYTNSVVSSSGSRLFSTAPASVLSERLHHFQAQMALDRIEITVAMQKPMAVEDAKSADDHVDCLADRHASRTQQSIISRAGDCDPPANHFAKFECGEKS